MSVVEPERRSRVAQGVLTHLALSTWILYLALNSIGLTTLLSTWKNKEKNKECCFTLSVECYWPLTAHAHNEWFFQSKINIFEHSFSHPLAIFDCVSSWLVESDLAIKRPLILKLFLFTNYACSFLMPQSIHTTWYLDRVPGIFASLTFGRTSFGL